VWCVINIRVDGLFTRGMAHHVSLTRKWGKPMHSGACGQRLLCGMLSGEKNTFAKLINSIW
jgi:hypothetical protein